MERCCFSSVSHRKQSTPVQLGRCRELSRKWLVVIQRLEVSHASLVGRYDWPAGDLSSKKTFALTVLCPQNLVVTLYPMPLTY